MSWCTFALSATDSYAAFRIKWLETSQPSSLCLPNWWGISISKSELPSNIFASLSCEMDWLSIRDHKPKSCMSLAECCVNAISRPSNAGVTMFSKGCCSTKVIRKPWPLNDLARHSPEGPAPTIIMSAFIAPPGSKKPLASLSDALHIGT